MNSRKIAATLLLMSPLWASSVSAGDLLAAASRASALRAAQAPVAPVAAPFENPNKGTALILGGIGAGLIVLGVVYQSGVECKDTSTNTSFGVKCGQTANKGLVIAGLAAGAVGGLVYARGKGKKSATITLGPSGIAFQQRIRF